jgi:hypothetical protein
MDINEAMVTLQNFLEKGNVIYAVSPDGETFTLENGCLLLTVDNSHMQTYIKEVKMDEVFL